MRNIVERFKQEYPSMKMKEVSYQVILTKEMHEHLLQMTPLYWGASKEDQDYSKKSSLKNYYGTFMDISRRKELTEERKWD